MSKPIVINTGAYFEWHVKLVAGVMMVVGFAWITQNLIAGILLIIISVVPFGMNYFLLIDPERRMYQDGVSFFGFRSGASKRYQRVEYLFLKENKVTRRYNSRIQSSAVTDLEFDGYIRFSEREKIHLCSNTDREVVMKELTALSATLKVQIFDYTRDGGIVVHG